jgi:predicted Zn-dependent peptidase
MNKDVETIAFEKLHSLAFRDNGLGNNLYINQYDFKRLHPQHVQKHISDFFFPGNRMVIVNVGSPHDKLVENLNGFVDIKNKSGTFELDVYEPLPQVTPTPQENKYYGGEAVIEGGKNTFVGLGFPGAGFTSGESYAYAILKELLGGVGSTKLGEAPLGRIYRNLGKTPYLIQASSFNISYVDKGLFGIFAEAKGGNAKELVNSLLNEIKNLQNITNEELTRAKAVAKGKLLRERECRLNFGNTVAMRNFGGSTLQTINNELQSIDQVTLENIKSVVQKMTSSTPSLVTLGDVRGTPKL